MTISSLLLCHERHHLQAVLRFTPEEESGVLHGVSWATLGQP